MTILLDMSTFDAFRGSTKNISPSPGLKSVNGTASRMISILGISMETSRAVFLPVLVIVHARTRALFAALSLMGSTVQSAFDDFSARLASAHIANCAPPKPIPAASSSLSISVNHSQTSTPRFYEEATR